MASPGAMPGATLGPVAKAGSHSATGDSPVASYEFPRERLNKIKSRDSSYLDNSLYSFVIMVVMIDNAQQTEY